MDPVAHTAIDQLIHIRAVIGRLISDVSEEALFRVPPGFSNHIAWNAGHVVATQQILHYVLSGLEPQIPGELIDRYRKGTGPATADRQSYASVIAFLNQAPERFLEDYENGAFTSFNRYETSTGIILMSIEDAIVYNNMHEGMHAGYIMAMKRVLATS